MRIYVMLIMIVVGVVPMIILSIGLIGAYYTRANTNRLSEVQRHGSFLVNRFLPTGALLNPEDVSVDDELALMASIYEGRILIVNKDLNVIRDTYGQEVGKTMISQNVVRCMKGGTGNYVNRYKRYSEVIMPITSSNAQTPDGVLVIVFSTNTILGMETLLGRYAFLYVLSLTIIIAGLACLYSYWLAKPLNSMVKSIDHLSEGYMDEEVSFNGYREVFRISGAFNRLLSKVRSLERSRQEFVSNVSHELKTPITSMKVLADSLLTQNNVPNEMYREFLTDINEEIERENKIINDLLSLVRLDKAAGEVKVEDVNINGLLEGILKRLQPIAGKRRIELIFESFRPVTAEVDEVKISLAISNLIENAIKYNVDEGWVKVSLNADHKHMYIKVSDSGLGIPQEAQDRIFDRFYRVDKARTRETGGTGLGLAITKNVVMLHKGAIKVYSRENEGTTFTVRLPLNYIP